MSERDTPKEKSSSPCEIRTAAQITGSRYMRVWRSPDPTKEGIESAHATSEALVRRSTRAGGGAVFSNYT